MDKFFIWASPGSWPNEQTVGPLKTGCHKSSFTCTFAILLLFTWRQSAYTRFKIHTYFIGIFKQNCSKYGAAEWRRKETYSHAPNWAKVKCITLKVRNMYVPGQHHFRTCIQVLLLRPQIIFQLCLLPAIWIRVKKHGFFLNFRPCCWSWL